ncbi:MAG: LptF/LptG family permease [bacterium]
MKILTKHILREFIKPFIFSLFLFSVIILVSELFENLDTFLSTHTSFNVILKYLLAYAPISFFEIVPVATLLAVLFSLSTFVQRGEFTAVKSAGIYPIRILFPLLLTGILISFLIMIGNDTITPRAVELVNKIYYKEVRNIAEYKNTIWDNLVIRGQDNKVFFINRFDYNTKKFTRIVINTYQNDDILANQIDAESMGWDNENSRWYLHNGIERFFTQSGNDIVKEIPFTDKIIDLKERPIDFIPRIKKLDEMTFNELKKLITKLKKMGLPFRKELVELHMKISYPFSNFIIMLIGIPFALLVRKSGRMLNFAFAIAIAFFYWGLLSLGRSMGESGILNPLIAAWFSNFIIGSIGIVALFKSKM